MTVLASNELRVTCRRSGRGVTVGVCAATKEVVTAATERHW